MLLGLRKRNSISPMDPDFAFVVSLLHFQGAAGGTVFTDQKPPVWTVDHTAGFEARTNDPSAVFGGAAAPLYGLTTSGDFASSVGAYNTTPDSAALRIGSQDFCIEFQIQSTGFSAFGSYIGKGYAAVGDWLIQASPTTGYLTVYFSGAPVLAESSGTVNTLQWYQIRLRRSGTALTLERDAVIVASAVDSTNLNSTQIVTMGALGAGGPGVGNPASAFYAEWRWTIGAARATGVLQTAPWPDS